MNAIAEPPPVAPLSVHESQWGWAIVFVGNLPVPLFFGFMMVEKGGLIGMLAGIVVGWFLGHLLITHVRSVRGPLLFGGGCVALTQIFPILQIWAGDIALGNEGQHQLVTVWKGFVVTLLTGGQLVAAALMGGLVVRVCSPILRVLGRFFAGHPGRDLS